MLTLSDLLRLTAQVLWNTTVQSTIPQVVLTGLCCMQDNLIRGRFLAELTREVFTDLEASKYQHAEMRISIYGRKQVGLKKPLP